MKLIKLFKHKKKRSDLLLEKYNNGEVLKIDDGTENVKYVTDIKFPKK